MFSAECQIGLSSPPTKNGMKNENTRKFMFHLPYVSCFALSNSPSKNTKKDPPVSWNQSSACDTAMALVFPPQALGHTDVGGSLRVLDNPLLHRGTVRYHPL